MKFNVKYFNVLMAFIMLFVNFAAFNYDFPFWLYVLISAIAGVSLSVGLVVAIDQDAEASARRIIAQSESQVK